MFDPLVERAIRFALEAHRGQTRKGQPGVPYVVHPMHVGMILARHDFSPEVCCAGILHDVIEDCGISQAELADLFGSTVARWVDEVSEEKGLSWQERKRATIDSIASMSNEARAVIAADKLHNLADIEWQREDRGDAIWAVFSRGKDDTVQYYRSVAEELRIHFPHPITRELLSVVGRVAV